MTLLQVENLTKTFGGLTAVSDLDFSVEKGELVGIIGPNGAGKSTIFNLICGEIKPTSGKVSFNNQDITDSSTVQSRRIDYVPGYDLPEGIHQVRVVVSSNYGITATHNWSFELQKPANIEDNTNKPNEFYLAQNYPNPFNPNTKISFNLPEPGIVTVSIFDSNGSLVSMLVNNQFYSAGKHNLHFDGESLASGVYFYNLVSGNKSITKKMLLLR